MTDLSTLSERLCHARQKAGFQSVAEAVQAFDWKYSTYAGHENGHRGPKQHDIQKYADAFGVSAMWLLSGQNEPKQSVQPAPTGLSESLREYRAPTDSMRLTLERLASQIAPHARSVTTLLVPRNFPTLALLRGDIVFVDLSTINPAPGHIVVSRIVDDAGVDETTFRLSAAGGPVPPYGEPALNDDQVEGIIGTVIGSMRGAPTNTLTHRK